MSKQTVIFSGVSYTIYYNGRKPLPVSRDLTFREVFDWLSRLQIYQQRQYSIVEINDRNERTLQSMHRIGSLWYADNNPERGLHYAR